MIRYGYLGFTGSESMSQCSPVNEGEILSNSRNIDDTFIPSNFHLGRMRGSLCRVYRRTFNLIEYSWAS
ncbi:MAG TPA: hypothetical protein DCQ96_11710 [Verrucomicrobiales bacterium]|nr:hypothetical protein [Verrucomicrobiales bacterium]